MTLATFIAIWKLQQITVFHLILIGGSVWVQYKQMQCKLSVLKIYISERLFFNFLILSTWMTFEATHFPTVLLCQVNTRVQISSHRQFRAPSASGRGTAQSNKAAGEHLWWLKKKEVKKSTPQLRNLCSYLCNYLPVFSLYCLEAKDDLTLCVFTIISHFGGHSVISLPDRGNQKILAAPVSIWYQKYFEIFKSDLCQLFFCPLLLNYPKQFFQLPAFLHCCALVCFSQ